MGKDRRESVEKTIKAFFRREAADGEEIWSGTGGPGRGCGDWRIANCAEIDGIEQDRQTTRTVAKMLDQVAGHGGGLADEGVVGAVEVAVEEVGGRGELETGGGGLKAACDAGSGGKKWLDEEEHVSKMGAAGKDDLGTDGPDEAQEAEGGVADSGGLEAMNGDARGQG